MNIKTERVWIGLNPDTPDEWQAWNDDSSEPRVYTGRTEQEAIANLTDLEDA